MKDKRFELLQISLMLIRNSKRHLFKTFKIELTKIYGPGNLHTTRAKKIQKFSLFSPKLNNNDKKIKFCIQIPGTSLVIVSSEN